MQEGAVVITGAGDILFANARFAALVAEPLKLVVGSRIDRFVNPLRIEANSTRCSRLGARRLRSSFIRRAGTGSK